MINVAMPSAYRFMEKVIQELAAMYEEAGVPLTTVHLGGDEVARGVWLGSPKCRALMKEEGMTKPHDLAEYFITQMAGIMQRNGFGAYRRGSPAIADSGGRRVLLEYSSGLR